ncbi:MAG TPA: hypothetical protein VMC02_13180, partial [Steroidobacteraceae bacterium]|nr:hypothetical protein [Steroidobacteraceae bacterium]
MAATEPDQLTAPGQPASSEPQGTGLQFIQVLHTEGGRQQQTLLTAADIAGGPVRVSGYVTGILVLCDDSTIATLDG